MSTSLEDRVILLLREQSGDIAAVDYDGEEKARPLLGGHGFWERLAERTGVLSRRWRKVYAREQKVTSDMLQAVARLFPSYAFWLATGITDAVNGHLAPSTAQTFPERLRVDSPASSAYFRASIELADRLFHEGRVSVEDDAERLYAAERTRPLAHWHDSPLVDVAYQLTDTPEYARLQELWQRREDERALRLTRKDHKGNRRRAELLPSGAKTAVLGIDARTAHQHTWDLFYIPAGRKSRSRSR